MPVTKQDLNNVDFLYENAARSMVHKLKQDLMKIVIRDPSVKTSTFTFRFELYENTLVQRFIQTAKHEFPKIIEETVTQYYDLHDQRELIFVRLNFNWDLLNEAFIVYNEDSSSEEEQD
jgi:hypothetical protein